MIGHLCHTAGSPNPTLVLDRRALPAEEPELVDTLLVAREWLAGHHGADITSVAMIEPSAHSRFDLDYAFAQYLDGAPGRFALQGSCGHSLLSSVAVADRLAWLPRLAPASRLRVNVLNTGDDVVCEVDEVSNTMTSAVEFTYPAPRRLGDLLPAGAPLLRIDGVPVSLVSAGNPHVFVDAAELGLYGQDALFSADVTGHQCLAGIRRQAARALGLPPDGVFPRVAVVGQYQYRRLAVHTAPAVGEAPALAPADSVTVAAAAAIDGTIPHRLARQGWSRLDELVIDTPGGTTVTRLSVTGSGADDTVARAIVRRKTVQYRGSVFIEPLRDLMLTSR